MCVLCVCDRELKKVTFTGFYDYYCDTITMVAPMLDGFPMKVSLALVMQQQLLLRVVWWFGVINCVIVLCPCVATCAGYS